MIRGSGHSNGGGKARAGSVLKRSVKVKGKAVEQDVAVFDLILLEQISEAAVLKNIEEMYMMDHIYIYIGNVVISVNPYKKLPIYDTETIDKYRGRSAFDPKLPPHIFALADNAFSDMKYRARDQVVIISGESGAGKTEASKQVMQYISAISGKSAACGVVKDKLLNTNPVLEAFGNAKTTRNDNSSRFGKYMDIQFDHRGDPMGGQITTYLLEKARVTRQGQGERNFHIFYQLLASPNAKKLGLDSNPKGYNILKQGGDPKVRGMNDGNGFVEVTEGLKFVDFKPKDADLIWSALGAILLLGEVTFKSAGGAGSAINKMPPNLPKLLMSTKADIEKALTHNTINAGGSLVSSDLTPEKAADARDTLMKAMYQRLFEWICKRINSSIQADDRGVKAVVGVLDIYGFEIFEQNGFEQFCINYCNEKLQQLFIELTLKAEQDEYIAEGVQWDPIDYFNNKIICDLIDQKRVGIVATLEEESIKPGEKSDERWLETMAKTIGKHDHFKASTGMRDKSIPSNAFKLVHYAGDVVYTVDGFLDKNTDTLFQDLARLMYTSKNAALKDCFPEGDESTWKGAKKRPLTAGRIFTNSMAEMIKILNSKTPSYIRCIKPNDVKATHKINQERFKHQVKYLGLVENVRVRRAGYCFRETYDDFLQRYRILSDRTYPRWSGSAKDGTVEIMNALAIQPSGYQLGKTKIFIKHPKQVFRLEEERDDMLDKVVVSIQLAWRAWKIRKIIGAYVTNMQRAVNPVKALDGNKPKYGYSPSTMKWPKPAPQLKNAHSKLMPLYAAWWAYKMIHPLSQEKKDLFRLQLKAHVLLSANKAGFKISAYKWKGFYAVEDPPGKKKEFQQEYGAKPLWTDDVVKVSRKGVPGERILILTKDNVYLTKKWKTKPTRIIPLENLTVITPKSKDTVVVLQGGPTDWVLSLSPSTMADLLAKISSKDKRKIKQGATVKVARSIKYDSGAGEKTLEVKKVAGSGPTLWDKPSKTMLF